MATVSTIGTASRNYSTIGAWYAAFAAGGWEGDCYNDAEFVVAGGLTLSGAATSGTNYALLTTGAGQSFRDNASKATNALTYNASNGVGIRSTNNYSVALTIGDQFVTLSGLQIQNTGFNNDGSLEWTQPNVTVNNCIVSNKDGSSGNINSYPAVGSGGGSAVIVRNTVFELLSGNPPQLVESQGTLTLYFCTIVNATTNTPSKGVNSNYFNVTLENTAIFGATTCAAAGGTLSATTCMTDQASPPTGFTHVTYTNQFQNISSGTQDWRTKTGADLIGAGTADSTNGATDILGTARP